MGLYMLGRLWPPKQGGGKSIASGYIQTPGHRARVVVLPAKEGKGYVIMCDDGEEQKDRQQGQGGGQRQGGGGWGGGGGAADGGGEGGGGWDDVPF
jgi:hypothetical protein